MVRSKFRGAVLVLATLFTAACGGPPAEEPVASQPESSEEVTAQAYTCGATNGTCPTGYKCCYPCGIPDCQWQCMAVTRCPMIP